MDCKEFERLIPEFIQHKMDFQTQEKFIQHMKCCQNCSEELEIQFLVAEGMLRLEDGDAFDLQGELETQLEEAGRRVRFHQTFLKAGSFLEIAAVLLLAAAVVYILI